MIPCCVCKNSGGHESAEKKKIRYFRFPKNERAKEWVRIMDLSTLENVSIEELNKNFRICSMHFDSSQFNNKKDPDNSRLHASALPSPSLAVSVHDTQEIVVSDVDSVDIDDDGISQTELRERAKESGKEEFGKEFEKEELGKEFEKEELEEDCEKDIEKEIKKVIEKNINKDVEKEIEKEMEKDIEREELEEKELQKLNLEEEREKEKREKASSSKETPKRRKQVFKRAGSVTPPLLSTPALKVNKIYKTGNSKYVVVQPKNVSKAVSGIIRKTNIIVPVNAASFGLAGKTETKTPVAQSGLVSPSKSVTVVRSIAPSTAKPAVSMSKVGSKVVVRPLGSTSGKTTKVTSNRPISSSTPFVILGSKVVPRSITPSSSTPSAPSSGVVKKVATRRDSSDSDSSTDFVLRSVKLEAKIGAPSTSENTSLTPAIEIVPMSADATLSGGGRPRIPPENARKVMRTQRAQINKYKKKILQLKEKNKEMKMKWLQAENKRCDCLVRLPGSKADFLQEQIAAATTKKMGHAWSNDMKLWTLELFLKSPAAYYFLSAENGGKLALPGTASLLRGLTRDKSVVLSKPFDQSVALASVSEQVEPETVHDAHDSDVPGPSGIQSHSQPSETHIALASILSSSPAESPKMSPRVVYSTVPRSRERFAATRRERSGMVVTHRSTAEERERSGMVVTHRSAAEERERSGMVVTHRSAAEERERSRMVVTHRSAAEQRERPRMVVTHRSAAEERERSEMVVTHRSSAEERERSLLSRARSIMSLTERSAAAMRDRSPLGRARSGMSISERSALGRPRSPVMTVARERSRSRSPLDPPRLVSGSQRILMTSRRSAVSGQSRGTVYVNQSETSDYYNRRSREICKTAFSRSSATPKSGVYVPRTIDLDQSKDDDDPVDLVSMGVLQPRSTSPRNSRR